MATRSFSQNLDSMLSLVKEEYSTGAVSPWPPRVGTVSDNGSTVVVGAVSRAISADRAAAYRVGAVRAATAADGRAQAQAAAQQSADKAAQKREIVMKISADQAAAELAAAQKGGTVRVWTPEKRTAVDLESPQSGSPQRGVWVRVTTDAALFERECMASGLSWPNLVDGPPRSTRLGAQGFVEKIDFSDLTVDLSDDVRWVPIGALVGFENFRQQHSGSAAKATTAGQEVANERLLAAFAALKTARRCLVVADEQLHASNIHAADQAAILQARALTEISAAEGAVSAAERAVPATPRTAKRQGGCFQGCFGGYDK